MRLAPKPKSPDDSRPPASNRRQNGQNKVTPYNDFDSIQELAALGTTCLSVRPEPWRAVNTQLLWSNIATVRNGQVAGLLFLVSQEMGATTAMASPLATRWRTSTEPALERGSTRQPHQSG